VLHWSVGAGRDAARMSERPRRKPPDENERRPRDPRYSQSLQRGLAILRCFTPKRPVLGIADIADDLGMSRSTTHRYVITLVALGYLEQGAARKYRLGLRVTDLGMSALNSTGLREHAHPFLEELRQRTSYTTSLGVLDGIDVLYVDRVRSFRRGQGEVDLDLRTGSRVPAYCTSMGKLLLANLPEADQRELIAEMTLTKRGPNTITSKKALREELNTIHGVGVAVADQEFAAELYAVAAPVRDDTRDVVAAVNLVVHSATVSTEEFVALSHLVSTAGHISARMGYRGDADLSGQSSDLSLSTLTHLGGQVSDPRLSTVLRLCRGLGVTAGELLGGLPLPTEARLRQARQVASVGGGA
jgi:IclR family pca regulon transcriptional regulator